MIEDVAEDVEMVSRVLTQGNLSFDIRQVDQRDEYIAELVKFKPDVILSDHSLPQFNSVEALEICHRIGISAPFILVTGTVSEEFAVTCLKNGADNYVLKGNLSRLPSAIVNALEHREADRNRKQAEKELHKQNQVLVKINQELDRFVYSASHNLRAPLMSVLGLLNIARKEVANKDTSRLLEYFHMMDESIEKLDNTLKEIVDYSKNSRIEVKIEKVNLKEIVMDCLDKLKYLEGANRLKTELVMNNHETIYCDPYRLNIIFINLISNAIKYRDVNKPENTLLITSNSQPHKTTISLKDNGIGIFSGYVSKVFDMFYRASDKSTGAGLGLYIVKETIDRLNGKVSIDTAIGEGSTVEFEIPFGYQLTR